MEMMKKKLYKALWYWILKRMGKFIKKTLIEWLKGFVFYGIWLLKLKVNLLINIVLEIVSPSKQFLQKLFEAYDRNGDGVITVDEYEIKNNIRN